jgi:nucleoside-diphosphate-sugar epimerase
MTASQMVLLLGGTGRTGRHVLEQLLHRGIQVRAIVRSAQRLPPGALDHPNLTVVEADLLSLASPELRRHLDGCEAVISCLGHVLSLRGMYGPPRDLVTRATRMLCQEVDAMRPASPVKFILMSSVSVNDPGGHEAPRGLFERGFIAVVRALLPPAMDNQEAANYLHDSIGTNHPFLAWTVLRPDSLLRGEMSKYALHKGLVSSVFAPDHTSMANIAHFMGELVTHAETWNDWRGRLPVIIDGGGRTPA